MPTKLVPAQFSVSMVFLHGGSGQEGEDRALLSQEEPAALKETPSVSEQRNLFSKGNGPQKMELPEILQEVASERSPLHSELNLASPPPLPLRLCSPCL